MSSEMFDVIKSDLTLLEESLRDAVKSDTALVTEVGRHLLEAGGKRIRPALCLLAAHGSPNFSLEKVLPLATAFELIHTASLVHDDVIDEADTRRGEQTANAKWNNQVAILSGDFVFARAFRLVADADYGGYVFSRLADLVCNLSIGEIIQDQEVYKAYSDESHYFDRIKKKTADFLEISCELGGRIVGLSDEVCKNLSIYGHSIGMAFQITDDLFDVEQTSEIIGKPVGNDIRQGLVTLPLIRAMNVSEYSGELEKIVRNPNMTDADVTRAIEIVCSTDAVKYSREKAQDYLNQAKNAIPEEFSPKLKEAFSLIADFIGNRDF